MSENPQVRQLCALLRDGLVLTDERGRIPSYVDEHPWVDLQRRAITCGDPGAVLVAPQVLVGPDERLLMNVFASRTETAVDGTWTALDAVAEPDPAVRTTLRSIAAEVEGTLAPPARRPDWFRVSWYAEVDAWIDAELAARGRTRTGPALPVKVWSLSAVLEVPCDPAPVWFKASCRHFHAEPALTRLVVDMLPEHAPPVIAVDEERGWLLMEEMAGADEEYEDAPPPGMGAAAGRIAATLQLRSLEHLEQIEAAGVPVRGLAETMHGFDEVLATSVELAELTQAELDAARAVRDDVHSVVAELASLGLPDTLVHGDLHPGNIAHDGNELVLYDWSDAAVSHPLLDLVHVTERLPDDEAAEARSAYAEVWRTAYPDLDLDRALVLAEQVNLLFQMMSYEQIYRDQEDASYWEMRGVVARSLRRLPERFPGSRDN
jgi:aminoglycoside phosphotransferase (APT) family kinase protein